MQQCLEEDPRCQRTEPVNEWHVTWAAVIDQARTITVIHTFSFSELRSVGKFFPGLFGLGGPWTFFFLQVLEEEEPGPLNHVDPVSLLRCYAGSCAVTFLVVKNWEEYFGTNINGGKTRDVRKEQLYCS